MTNHNHGIDDANVWVPSMKLSLYFDLYNQIVQMRNFDAVIFPFDKYFVTFEIKSYFQN